MKNATVSVTVSATSATDWTAKFDEDELRATLEEVEVNPSVEIEVGDYWTPTYVGVKGCAYADVEVTAIVTFEGAELTEEEQEAIAEKLEWPGCVSFECSKTVEYRVRNRGRSKECSRDVNYTVDWTTGDTGLCATYSAGC